jgi:hypothetical protein
VTPCHSRASIVPGGGPRMGVNDYFMAGCGGFGDSRQQVAALRV